MGGLQPQRRDRLMGADFLLVAVKNEFLPQDQLDVRIDALSDKQLAEVRYDRIGEEHIPTEDEVATRSWEPIGYDQEDWRNDVRLYLKECAAEIFFNDSRRDTMQLNLSGDDWVFAGGMSWGDDPSDAFRMISALQTAGF